MQRIILLHTNDVHGRVKGLARAATLIERIRAENPGVPVVYFDAGDIEETSVRLSNLTKGVAMHRLLTATGCAAHAVGNGAALRYGPSVLAAQAAAARYPLLLANMRNGDGSVIEGARATALIETGGVCIGLIGITSEVGGMYESAFGVRILPVLPLVRELAAELRNAGADTVLLLSHMGLDEDHALAAGLQDVVPLVIGAHSHHLLPEGERIGSVVIAQAGEYAQYLGRVDVLWDGLRLHVLEAGVLPITDDIVPAERVMREARAAEDEVERFLQDVIGELAEPLDYSTEWECGVANLMADALRERMHADVGLVSAGQAFTGGLEAGPVRRIALWDICGSSANPGVVALTGEQLTALVAKGLDPVFAADCPRTLRGQARGVLHLSGAAVRDGQLYVAGKPIDAEGTYRVAGSDWELDVYGGYAKPDWALKPEYDSSVILREALEDYLAAHRPVTVEMGRIAGALSQSTTTR